MKVTRSLRMLQGNRVATMIEDLHRAENELASDLFALADRHRVDHEICYVARDIARWSQQHVRRLSECGRGYDLDLDPDPEDDDTLLARLRQKGSELTGRLHEPSLLLLADLRQLHRAAAGLSLEWEVLGQTAQAVRDTDLIAMTEQCHPETVRQLRWASAKVKETAAQTLVAG